MNESQGNIAGQVMATPTDGADKAASNGYDPKNESRDVKLWLERVSLARKYKDRILEDMGVPRFFREYFGEYDVKLGGMLVPPIGEIFAYVDSSLSDLYQKDPYIAVNPNKKATVQGAALLETAINYHWRVLRSKEEIEMEIIDALLAGHAWHKSGMSIKTVGAGENIKIESEKFYSNRVSWKDVVFNIGARRPPLDCRWIAQRIVRPTDEVKEKYGLRAAGIQGGPHPALKDDEIKSANFKSDLNFTTMWEIHDIKERKVYLVAENHDKYLKEPVKWPGYQNEFPFRMLWFHVNPDNPYPLSSVKPWEPQVLEKIKFVAMIMNHLKRFSRQIAVKKGAISTTEMDKFEKGIDGAMIEVKTSGNPAEAAVPFQYAPLPPEIFMLLNKLDEIKVNVNGNPSVNNGAPQRTSSRTEGELIMMKEGAKGRMERKVDRLEGHIENVARDMIKMMQANFDMEQNIRITGDTPKEIIAAFGDKFNPATKSITFTKEDIQGEYDVDVQAGSTLPLDKETRMQLLSMVLEKASRLAQLPSIPDFIKVIITELLKNYDMPALEEAFERQQIQAVQAQKANAQNQQIEQDKIKAETAKRYAQADEQKAETVLKVGEALHRAHQANVLPEAVELGRGMGIFPDEGPNSQQQIPMEPIGSNGGPPQGAPNGMP